MGRPAARVTDMHVCPMVTGLVPHVGGPIIPPCMPTVITGKMPQARVSDKAICVGPTDVIVKGSSTVLVGGLPAARMGDNTAHGGVIVTGCFTVLIGDAGGGGGGGGGAAGAGLSAASAFSDPAAQAKALINAAKSGMPFCEKCAAAVPESAWDWTTRQAAAAATAASDAAHSAATAARNAATAASRAIRELLTDPPKKYGKAIFIEGDDEFRKKVVADLEMIKKTPTGAKLLESIDKSPRSVKIVKSPLDNRTYFDEISGGNGVGSDSLIEYLPDRQTIGIQEWSTRPPAIGLAHELIHAYHAGEGSVSFTEVANDSKRDASKRTGIAQIAQEEVRAAGIPPYANEKYTENKIRSEWNPKQPERKWY